MPRQATRTFCTAAAAIGPVTAAAAAGPLQYAFKADVAAGPDVVYRVTAVLDEAAGPTTTVGYVQYAPTAAGDGWVGLACRATQQVLPGRGGTATPPAAFFGPLAGTHFTVGRDGKPAAVTTPDPGELPAAVGATARVPLPPLPADGAVGTWTLTAPAKVVRTGRPHSEATGTRTDRYTAGPADGDAVPVSYTTDMTVSGEALTEHLTGRGSFLFDGRRGLVRSLSATYTADGKIDGVRHSAPIRVDAQLLSADEVAKLRPQPVASRSGDGLPPGTERTASVGGPGGSPFVKAGDGRRPVVGLRLKLGQWDGHAMVGGVEPMYDRAGPPTRPGDAWTVMVAKDGYAVGGAWLNGSDMACALRLIYMRQAADGTLDPNDTYDGPWFGQVVDSSQVKLGGTGQPVVGVYGRQGMNTDALGLVVRSADDPTRKGIDRER